MARQTNTDFNVILVNDGSTDTSESIAKKYAEQYPQMFTYIYQENKGLGAARNTGLQAADTEYVTFLDSDDMWLPRNVENIYSAIDSYYERPDLFYTCPRVFDMSNNGFFDWSDNEKVKEIFRQYGDMISAHKVHVLYNTEASVCRMIIQTKLLKDHHFAFPEGIKWEDVYPHFAILRWANKCALLENVGFVYRINSGTQITSLSDSRRLDIIPAFTAAFDFAKDNMDLSETAFIFVMMMDFISWFLKASNKDVYPQLIEELHAFAKKLPDEYFQAYCKYIPRERKRKILWKFLKSDSLYKVVASERQYKKFKQAFNKMNDWRHRICRT